MRLLNFWKWFFVSSIVLGCASKPTQILPKKQLSPRQKLAKKIVKKFERIYRKKITQTSKIVFKDLKRPHVGGMCNMITKKITLNTPNWDDNTDVENEIILFHELGHCELDRGHIHYDDKKWKYCTPSIMGWKGTPQDCYERHYDYYINELFTGCREFERLDK